MSSRYCVTKYLSPKTRIMRPTPDTDFHKRRRWGYGDPGPKRDWLTAHEQDWAMNAAKYSCNHTPEEGLNGLQASPMRLHPNRKTTDLP
jgi:hypothetical protein